MKKYLLILITGLMATGSFGQNIPWMAYINSLNNNYYYNDTLGANKVACASDSMFYLLHYGGIQYINTHTLAVKYQWADCYNANAAQADTAGNLIVLKNNAQIVKYNAQNGSVTDISPATGAQVQDIGVSTGKVWCTISPDILAIYDGLSWTYDTCTLPLTGRLLVQNDSVAYVMSNEKVLCFKNGSFTTRSVLPANTGLWTWDPDRHANIWAAVSNRLLKVDTGGVITTFDTSNTPISSDRFLTVLTDDSDHVYTLGNGYTIYKYDGHSWSTSFPPSGAGVNAAAINKHSGIVYVLRGDKLYALQNGLYNGYDFVNMPYCGITTLSPFDIATGDGIFEYSNNAYNYNVSLMPINFTDTTVANNLYANDVTCFVTHAANYYSGPVDHTYGTHHGIYGGNIGIHNTLLPDTNINCIFTQNGTYYIGTDKGLCVFNQGTYAVLDTSNAVLPSNKITFVTGYYDNIYDSALYIGTDKGLAIYSGGHWRAYDTATLHLSSFYVSGILPPAAYYWGMDTDLWITTIGNGLIRLDTNGVAQVLNTENGGFADDTLYYAIDLQLGECGQYRAVGTNSHGIAFWNNYSNLSFNYDTIANGNVSFHRSRSYMQLNPNFSIMTTDIGFAVAEACGAVKNIAEQKGTLKWNIEGNQLNVYLPTEYSGKTLLTVYDIQGRVVGNKVTDATAGSPVPMGIDLLAAGIYIVQANLHGQLLQTKVVISK